MKLSTNPTHFTFYPLPKENVIRISHSNYILLGTYQVYEFTNLTSVTWSEHTSSNFLYSKPTANYDLNEVLPLAFTSADITFKKREDFLETNALKLIYSILLLEYITEENILPDLINEKYLLLIKRSVSLNTADRYFDIDIYSKKQRIIAGKEDLSKLMADKHTISFYVYITPNQILVIE